MKFSSVFQSSTLSAAFDEVVARDAAAGRVPQSFALAMAGEFGYLELCALKDGLPVGSTSPHKAIKAINVVLSEPSIMPFVTGSGSQARNRIITRALHALGEALHAGAAKGLPMLLALPAWANEPEPKAKPKAKAKAKPDVVAEKAPEVTTEEAPKLTLGSAVNMVVAAAKGGALSAAQLDMLRTVLATAQAAPARGKAKGKAGEVVDVEAREVGAAGAIVAPVGAAEKAAILA